MLALDVSTSRLIGQLGASLATLAAFGSAVEMVHDAFHVGHDLSLIIVGEVERSQSTLFQERA